MIQFINFISSAAFKRIFISNQSTYWSWWNCGIPGLIDWFIDWLIDWWIDWLIDWLPCVPSFSAFSNGSRGVIGLDNAAIMELAVYYPSMTLTTFGLRYLPTVKRAKQLIDDDFIGKIQAFEVSLHCGPAEPMEKMAYEWTCIRELCAGPLFSTALHLVDLMYFLSGGKRVHTVCGTVRRFQSNPPQFKYDEHLTREDFISWQGLIEDDIPCNTVINNNSPGKFDLKITVSGATGSIVLENGNLYRDEPGRVNRELELSLRDSQASIIPPSVKTHYQSINQSINQSIKGVYSESINQSIKGVYSESINQSIKRNSVVDRSINQSMG